MCMRITEKEKLKTLPASVDNSWVLNMVKSAPRTSVYFGIFKTLTRLDDEEIAAWLNISVKTFRSHKSEDKPTKPGLFEHVIMLISLWKHGMEVFGGSEQFKTWVKAKNFYFDNQSPEHYLNTISGIKLLDDRLTAMEYGHNA